MGNSSGNKEQPRILHGKDKVYVHEYDAAEQHKWDEIFKKLGKDPVYVQEYDAAEQHKWDAIFKKLEKQKDIQNFPHNSSSR